MNTSSVLMQSITWI